MAGNVSKWLCKAVHCCTCLYIAGIAGNGWKYLPNDGMARNCWKLIDMAGMTGNGKT